MKKHIISIISLVFTSLVFLMPSCGKDDCLDLAELDLLKAEMEEWRIDTSLSLVQFRDQNNICQTLVLNDYRSSHHDVIVEDDCGNSYGSWDNSAQFSMSVSPLNFMVNIRGSGIEQDGFYIELSYYRTIGESGIHSAVYDLKTGKSRNSDTEINYIEEMTVDGKVYTGVIEAIFFTSDHPNDLERIYFAKEAGIIKFTDRSGNQYVRENNGQ